MKTMSFHNPTLSMTIIETPGATGECTALLEGTPMTPIPRQDLVLDLAAIDASMLPLVGGKAANLGELIGAELPVPRGICVTTEAYRQVAESAAIDYGAFSGATPEELKRLAGRAREAMLAAPIPMAIA